MSWSRTVQNAENDDSLEDKLREQAADLDDSALAQYDACVEAALSLAAGLGTKGKKVSFGLSGHVRQGDNDRSSMNVSISEAE